MSDPTLPCDVEMSIEEIEKMQEGYYDYMRRRCREEDEKMKKNMPKLKMDKPQADNIIKQVLITYTETPEGVRKVVTTRRNQGKGDYIDSTASEMLTKWT